MYSAPFKYLSIKVICQWAGMWQRRAVLRELCFRSPLVFCVESLRGKVRSLSASFVVPHLMALNERKEAAQLECSAFIRGLPNYSCSGSSLPTGNTWAWCAVRLRPLLKRSWMENSSQHKAALQKKRCEYKYRRILMLREWRRVTWIRVCTEFPQTSIWHHSSDKDAWPRSSVNECIFNATNTARSDA